MTRLTVWMRNRAAAGALAAARDPAPDTIPDPAPDRAGRASTHTKNPAITTTTATAPLGLEQNAGVDTIGGPRQTL